MNHMRYLWNYFQSERGYYTRRSEPQNRPFVFSIETTSICNLRCVMCPYKDMTRPNEMIDPPLFEKVIDEVAPYNGIVWLHNLGEPLAHPRISELIRYTKRSGLGCGLSTNATILDDARSDALFDSGLDKIILCMDGATKDTYEHLRSGANFEQVTANIERFLERKKRGGHRSPQAIVQLIYMRETEAQVREFRRRWSHLADRVHVKRFSTWADQVSTISGLSDARHRYEPEHSTSPTRHPCAYLWRNVVVTAAGDVIPCCVDFDARMVMGNVAQNSLLEIWHGDRFREIRSGHLEGRFNSVCGTCREWVGDKRRSLYPLALPTLAKLTRAPKKL